MSQQQREYIIRKHDRDIRIRGMNLKNALLTRRISEIFRTLDAHNTNEWRIDKAVCVLNPDAARLGPIDLDRDKPIYGQQTDRVGSLYILAYNFQARRWSQFHVYIYGLARDELTEPLYLPEWEDTSFRFQDFDPFTDPNYGYTPSRFLGTIYGLADELARLSDRYPIWVPGRDTASPSPRCHQWRCHEFIASDGLATQHTWGMDHMKFYLTAALANRSGFQRYPDDQLSDDDRRSMDRQRKRILDRILTLLAQTKTYMEDIPDIQHSTEHMNYISGNIAVYFYRQRRQGEGK